MIFIIWGKKRVETSLGRVADFCPVCRDLSAFEILRAGMAGHIYGLSAGDGELLGYVKECGTCGLRLGADLEQYSSIHPGSTDNVEALVLLTFPNAREKFAGRLEFEEQLQKYPEKIPSDVKRDYFKEPFILFNGVAEQSFGGDVPLDAASVLSAFATFLLTVGVFVLGAVTRKDKLLLGALILFGVGTAFTLVQFYLRPHRYVRRKVLPPLAKALAPLKPTESDLEQCLNYCTQMRMRIGKALNVKQIWSAMRDTSKRQFPATVS